MIRRKKPIKRSSPPRARRPKKFGTHRERVKYLNEIWRRLIYLKSPNGRCLICKTGKGNQAAHIFAKGPYPHMRFDLDNGVPLCVPCHRRFDGDNAWGYEWRQTLLGDPDTYERMKLRSVGRGKTDLQLVRLHLEAAAKAAGVVF